MVLVASIPLFLLGYLNRFGYYPVLMEYRENTQYIGFAGNKKLWEENKQEKRDVLTGACKLAVVAYAVHNLFSFQQVLNTPLMFILLGMAFPACTREDSILQER